MMKIISPSPLPQQKLNKMNAVWMLLQRQTWKQRAGFKAKEGTAVKVEISCCSRVLDLSQLCNMLITHAVEADPSHGISDHLLWARFLMWPQTDFHSCSYRMFRLPPSVPETLILRHWGEVVCQMITGLAKRNNSSRPTAPTVHFVQTPFFLWQIQWLYIGFVLSICLKLHSIFSIFLY